MKIQIIGYAGSGKSTLAKLLAYYYKINYIHLDNTQYYGNWQRRDKEEQNKIVEEFLLNNESWVIDGNYSKVTPRRFEESDITIFLNYNRFYCYKMCKKRYHEYKNKIRESCPCPEKFDLEFKLWILFNGRTKERRQQHLINLNKTKGQKLIFNNRFELNKWLIENNIINGDII